MSITMELTPRETAAAKVAELEGTVARWAAEGAAARAHAAAARARLDNASLEDQAEAYALAQSITAAEARAEAAASLGASARERLDAARIGLVAERAAEQRAAASRLWAAYRDHETRRRELLQALVDFDGGGYYPSAQTRSEALLDAAKAADELAAVLQVEACGESAVLRSEVAIDGRRYVWIGVAGPSPEAWDGRAAQRFFRVIVDGERWAAEPRIGTSAAGPVTWVRREFPAGAVVALEGETASFVDDPAALID